MLGWLFLICAIAGVQQLNRIATAIRDYLEVKLAGRKFME